MGRQNLIQIKSNADGLYMHMHMHSSFIASCMAFIRILGSRTTLLSWRFMLPEINHRVPVRLISEGLRVSCPSKKISWEKQTIYFLNHSLLHVPLDLIVLCSLFFFSQKEYVDGAGA